MKNNTFITTVGKRYRRTPMILGLSLALCMPFSSFAYANNAKPEHAASIADQAKTVNGIIIDETGEPMIGVSVLIKGTSIGTITDFDGHFTLDFTPGKTMLEVSYIGYKSQIITVGNKTQLNIKMEPDTQALEEVVVIGYGTVKKRDLTGSVTSVKSGDITLNPGSNPMQALQGKVAGMDITSASGKAGSGVNIQLRGTRTLQVDDDLNTKGGGPQFIIDGMPGDYSTLNPNDIESVEVLKDASSTAIYGSDGANGVVIITTKKAKEGRPIINFDARLGINGWGKTLKMRQGESFLQLRRDAYKAAGSYTTDEAMFPKAEEWAAVKNNQWVDWSDLIMHNGTHQDYSLSVTGGTEKTKGYFSFNLSDEEGMYKNQDNRIYALRAKIDHQLNKYISAGVNIQGSFIDYNDRRGVLDKAMNALPLGQPYHEDGSINIFPIAGDESTVSVLADEQDGVYKNNKKSTKIYANGYIEIKPIKGLSFRSQIGASLLNSRTGYFQGKGSSYSPKDETSDAVSGKYYTANGYNYKWENILTYNFTLAEKHDFTVTGVTTWNHDQSEDFRAQADNIKDNNLIFFNLNNAKNQKITNDYYEMSKGFGLIGRINYSYLGKYLFSASCRWDGSSRLATGNQWETYPAVALGWRISDEKFMVNTKNWLSNLKLRVGYGVSGAANIPAYSSTSGIVSSYMNFGGIVLPTYQMAQTIANPSLTWEKSYNTNIGLDASVLNNRIDLTADYYITTTKGGILSAKMPHTMGGFNGGQYTMAGNFCKTQNSGLELALSTRNIISKDFTWSSTITFATNKEKVKELVSGQEQMFIGTASDLVYKVGEPVASWYQYKKLGIWQLGEAETAKLFGAAPGDVKIEYPSVLQDETGYYYMDSNHERVDITADKPYTARADYDKQILGSRTPKWTGGFQNSFTYKNFDLSIFIYARFGQMIKYKTLLAYDPQGGVARNTPEYFDYWTPDNPTNDFPAANANKKFEDYKYYDSMAYVDGSFWKIKNITLGYTLPSSLCKIAGISKLRIYSTITDPFVFAKSHLLTDYDPEMGGANDFPMTKQLVFGVNLTF